jgi:uncharacterized membrane protein
MQHVRMIDASFVREPSLRSTCKTGSRAIHEVLVPFSVAYFTGALATDLIYWRTAEVMWERFSVWLITVGLITAGLAVIGALIDLASRRHKAVWPRGIGYALAVLLSLMNVFIHSRDGYTAVVPTGLTLSALVAIILLAMAPAGWTLASPRRVGADT